MKTLNIDKRCAAKTYFFSDLYNPFRDEMMRDEKLQYDINRKQKEYQHYHKIDSHEYLTCEEILPSDQSRAIKQARFIHSF